LWNPLPGCGLKTLGTYYIIFLGICKILFASANRKEYGGTRR
jgi:hypothetical protein